MVQHVFILLNNRLFQLVSVKSAHFTCAENVVFFACAKFPASIRMGIEFQDGDATHKAMV